MRFCFLTTFYPPFSFGGDAVMVQRLARALVRDGHRVTVVHDVDAFAALSPTPVTAAAAGADPVGVELVPLRTGFGALSPFLTQQTGRPVVNGRRIRALLDEGRFDVIVFNNISLVGGPGLLSYGGDAARLYLAHEHWLVCQTHVLWRHNRELCTGRQCVRCAINHGRPPQLWRFTGYLDRQLEHVDVFVAMSEFSRQKHREFGFPFEMEVVPPFVEDEEAAAPSALRNTSPHSRPYFLFVGRLEPLKGLDDVIPVMERYPDADLLIAGDGKHAPALSHLAANNPRVKFLGRLPQSELQVYYRHALALIAPSVCYETFGLIVIEAFRAKTPVIARRIGPFPEMIEQSRGGELFDNDEELLAAMRRLQHSPTVREGMGRAGYDAFRTHWSERAVLPRFLGVVDRALRRRTTTIPMSVAT